MTCSDRLYFVLKFKHTLLYSVRRHLYALHTLQIARGIDRGSQWEQQQQHSCGARLPSLSYLFGILSSYIANNNLISHMQFMLVRKSSFFAPMNCPIYASADITRFHFFFTIQIIQHAATLSFL